MYTYSSILFYSGKWGLRVPITSSSFSSVSILSYYRKSFFHSLSTTTSTPFLLTPSTSTSVRTPPTTIRNSFSRMSSLSPNPLCYRSFYSLSSKSTIQLYKSSYIQRSYSQYYNSSSSYLRYWPVYVIIGINVIIFCIYLMYAPENKSIRYFYSEHMVLSKSRLKRHYYTLFTYSYTQIDLLHILTNMITLYSFGTLGIDLLGTKRFLGLYTLAGINSGIAQLVYNQFVPKLDIPASYSTHTDNSLLGASGSIAGILAYGLIRIPNGTTILLIFPIPNNILLGIFIAGSLYLSYTGNHPGWAHFGHLGGMITGIVYGLSHRYRRRLY